MDKYIIFRKIAENLEESYELLDVMLKAFDSIHKDFTVNKARYIELRKAINSNQISYEDQTKTRNQIVKSLLDLVEEYYKKLYDKNDSKQVFCNVFYGLDSILDHLSKLVHIANKNNFFTYISRNSPIDVLKHDYLKNTESMIRDEKFSKYVRVHVLKEEEDIEFCLQLLNKFKEYTKFEFRILRKEKAFPLNIVTIAPSIVVIGFPDDITFGHGSNSMSLSFNSNTIYNNFNQFQGYILDNSIVIKKYGKKKLEFDEKNIRKTLKSYLT